MRIALCSAAYPPDLDGIGDYTWWLAGAIGDATVFTRPGPHLAQAGVTVIEAPLARLPDALAQASVDWLVFQYNPFSWGKRGWCPAVPRVLKEVKKRLPVAVMFHETTVPRWPWRFAIMRRWQRPIFRSLCHLSDLSFASSERYQCQIERIGASAPTIHLPVGSNLKTSSLSQKEARNALHLPSDTPLIGVFGSAHESRLLDWIAAAFQALQRRFPKAKMLYVGPHGEAISRALGGRENLIDLGIQPADQAGICICAMDLLLAPFNDGISTRRGSAIAALQNGVPVASTISKWTDSVFVQSRLPGVLLSAATTATEFAEETANWSTFLNDPATSARFRQEVREFHDRVFAWPVIARKLTDRLAVVRR